MKKSLKFQDVLTRLVQEPKHDRMLRLHIAATLGRLGHEDIEQAVAKEISESPGNSVPVVTWAETMLHGGNPRDWWVGFRLFLTYHGPQDKPYYNLILSVPMYEPPRANDFLLVERIDETQAMHLWDHLRKGEHAALTTQEVGRDGSDEAHPHYVLQYHYDRSRKPFEIDLGWGPEMLSKLDALRNTTQGRAQEALDRLLGRMSGLRREWRDGTGKP